MFNALLQLAATSYYGDYDSLISTNTASAADSGAFAAIMALFAGIWFIWLAVVIVAIIGLWKVFTKAGKPGWHSIIPFLNMYDLMEIAGYNGLLFLISLIPGVGALAFSIITALGIAKKFGQSTVFGVLTIFFSPIMYCVLGFGKATYQGKPGEGGENPFASTPTQA